MLYLIWSSFVLLRHPHTWTIIDYIENQGARRTQNTSENLPISWILNPRFQILAPPSRPHAYWLLLSVCKDAKLRTMDPKSAATMNYLLSGWSQYCYIASPAAVTEMSLNYDNRSATTQNYLHIYIVWKVTTRKGRERLSITRQWMYDRVICRLVRI